MKKSAITATQELNVVFTKRFNKQVVGTLLAMILGALSQTSVADSAALNFDLPPDIEFFSDEVIEFDTPGIPEQKNANQSSKAVWREQKVYPLNIVRLKPDGSMRIRGWKMNKTVYFGQTKVANQWGVGLLVERKGYHYAINNRGIAFLKKF